MTSAGMIGAAALVGALATSVSGAKAATQQAAYPPGAVVQAIPMDASELKRHLNTLAQNPRSLDALVGAARASLQAGDAEAALAFFSRADEVSPRDARVKAGLGSAFVHLGQAQRALSMFAEAASYGAPEVEIAGDRGLAFDMMGQSARAQQDYKLALTRGYDPELRRRMALSLAISGEKDEALAMIHDQLRRNIRAAWRTQAFILALTGDPAGATRTAQSALPAGQGAALGPFFQQLTRLTPAQKAMAIHFGQFPAQPGTFGQANVSLPAAPARPVQVAAPPPPRPTQMASVEPRTSSPPRSPADYETFPNSRIRVPQPGARTPPPELGVRRSAENVVQAASTGPSGRSSISDIATAVASLSDGGRSARTSSAQHWVQLAGVEDRAALYREFVRLRSLAPSELGNRDAFAVAQPGANRLLVGPFASPEEAQHLVGRLAARSVTATAWTSPPGQEIQPVP